jgi:hypothetical protein
MAQCNQCGAIVQWAWIGDSWAPLEPITTHDDLDRTYMDENGVLRADHRDRHEQHYTSVNAVRLRKKVPGQKLANPAEEQRITEEAKKEINLTALADQVRDAAA